MINNVSDLEHSNGVQYCIDEQEQVKNLMPTLASIVVGEIMGLIESGITLEGIMKEYETDIPIPQPLKQRKTSKKKEMQA